MVRGGRRYPGIAEGATAAVPDPRGRRDHARHRLRETEGAPHARMEEGPSSGPERGGAGETAANWPGADNTKCPSFSTPSPVMKPSIGGQSRGPAGQIRPARRPATDPSSPSPLPHNSPVPHPQRTRGRNRGRLHADQPPLRPPCSRDGRQGWRSVRARHELTGT